MSADILRSSLDVVRDQLNMHLGNIDDRGEPWVVATNIVGHDGAINPAARDKIVMSVYALLRETTIGSHQPTLPGASTSGTLAVVNPPLYLDVQLMFLANFGDANYGDGLAALSRVIAFFQQTPVLSRVNAPALDPAIDKLTLDFENLTAADVNYVMGMFGTRYLPSAFYKMRMLPFASTAMRERAYPVTAPATSADRP